ncbi:hypothetical protein CPB85DRAFT_445490 [Mucidula mucida]|nr:hypothetical protein CPB85DRAFT_445490 [Mucidula mucida]
MNNNISFPTSLEFQDTARGAKRRHEHPSQAYVGVRVKGIKAGYRRPEPVCHFRRQTFPSSLPPTRRECAFLSLARCSPAISGIDLSDGVLEAHLTYTGSGGLYYTRALTTISLSRYSVSLESNARPIYPYGACAIPHLQSTVSTSKGRNYSLEFLEG